MGQGLDLLCIINAATHDKHMNSSRGHLRSNNPALDAALVSEYGALDWLTAIAGAIALLKLLMVAGYMPLRL